MMDSLRARFRALRRRGHRWLSGHPRLQRVLEVSGSLRSHPEAIARGVAVGLFVGLTPTVGFQTALMITACILVAGNFPAAFAVSWISNPFTMAPLYWGFHSIGMTAVAVWPGPLPPADAWFFQGVGDELIFTGVGSLLVAIPVSVGGYFLTHRLTALLARRRSVAR
ncbi:hypothetical protein SAMN05660831_01627 [Thiohalospira halophila DSM 15071]|uniref:DUF2062 domain-containing protein n=1 Tax=Thiohalospira halophila DSM 15071 TaxID=1123397 RepID=A0A1I1SA13_9GAMM|nr:DUF2062 domain-containing protein [Thiohalospira halophila]SFD43335.1 hypothetical protein SAMN05660831_01627 [Thiohalospira halophila DSM 15071]